MMANNTLRSQAKALHILSLTLMAGAVVSHLQAGEWPTELRAYRGTTPKIDGVVRRGSGRTRHDLRE
ncbi:MAG: hypothetical protein AUJ92_00475 [Armatimonadetes bacterium CG2_30_59_28]|nr:MAG: hypothetical protein AUJ92_00475 [Armatimonadetes bacterium CG2_30_59_28]PIU65240.1 MAG: hypothetical protein COS85_09555 [Armatimonadetes bacterium CG07_land_8_20_14_0_80_59_28]